MTCLFISGADKCRYDDLNTELINDDAKGEDNWQASVDEAVYFLNTYQAKTYVKICDVGQTETALLQSSNDSVNTASSNNSGGGSYNKAKGKSMNANMYVIDAAKRVI